MSRHLCVPLVLAAVLVPLLARPYPIAPRTLWELTQEAELVVLAQVGHATELASDDTFDGAFADNTVAVLRVREVWKGTQPQPDVVEVRFNPDVVCPAPPVYEVGRVVVAFLARHEGAWRTVALSYGTRYPEGDGEVEALRQAVRDAARLQAEGGASPSARRDWQVRAAAHPATRWDGLYGLVPAADADRARYDPRARPASPLSRAQQDVLARGFVASPPVDPALPMMLAALRGYRSADVDAAAASALEAVVQEAPGDWAARALEHLRERLGGKARALPRRDPLEQTMRDAARGRTEDAAEEHFSLREQWERLEHEHRLRPAPLPPRGQPRVRGTGGDTPL